MLDNSDNEEWARYNYGVPFNNYAEPGRDPEQLGSFGVPINSSEGGNQNLSYWQSRHDEGLPGAPGVNDIFDERGQLKPGWKRTENGYEYAGAAPEGPVPPSTPPPTGGDYHLPGDIPTNFSDGPNSNFTWPTYNAPRFSYENFPGFKPWTPPSADQILSDPVLQAQLKEGNNRIKQDRAFRGILNTGDTLKDIFDWTGDRIKLGGNDAWDRSFKVYDVNERQNPFNTWSANRDLAFNSFDRNASQSKDEFLYNLYNPASKLWDQNYNKWAKTGDWLTQMSQPPG